MYRVDNNIVDSLKEGRLAASVIVTSWLKEYKRASLNFNYVNESHSIIIISATIYFHSNRLDISMLHGATILKSQRNGK